MKIGILTYHWVFNFGANLQALSTYCYLKNNGHTPVILNWVPADTEKGYLKKTPQAQIDSFRDFQNTNFRTTALCRNSKDLAQEIQKENIEAVIIGSDAIMVHMPFWSRFYFSRKKILGYYTPPQDRLFPNPFWGEFQDHLDKKLPLAMLSGSCQNSDFGKFSAKTVSGMKERLGGFRYISVRDEWTRDLVKHVSGGRIDPVLSRDPVFAFNQNAATDFDTSAVIRRFDLPDKYRLVSFTKHKSPSKDWIRRFAELSKADGIPCYALAMPTETVDFGVLPALRHPVSPLEWYALIKHSQGYVGHNMHPVVTAIHNNVPFFSFDHYGLSALEKNGRNESSKIYHILDAAGLADYRVAAGFSYQIAPEQVHAALRAFPLETCRAFSEKAARDSIQNMDAIVRSLVS